MHHTTTDRISSYLDDMVEILRSIPTTDVRDVVNHLFGAWINRSTIYIIGNGGSASTASHMMNDLNKMTSFAGAKRFRAISLTDNMPYITAIGNDLDYGDVFVEQLKNFLLPGDTLIALSGSGESENIIRATKYAQEIDAFVIGLCGRPGSRLCESADMSISISAKLICHQEDCHLILNHAIALALRERIAATL